MPKAGWNGDVFMLGTVPFGLASIMVGITVGLLANPLMPAATGATPKGLVGIVDAIAIAGRGFIIIGVGVTMPADMKGMTVGAAFGMSIG